MTELQKAMIMAKLSPSLLRIQAGSMAKQVNAERVKERHRFAYAYAVLAAKKLGVEDHDMLKRLPEVSLGLEPQETLNLFEFLIFSYGTGWCKNPWLGLDATLAYIGKLPASTRWRGETNLDAELTLWRGVSADSVETAMERHLRPLWSTWKAQSLACCIDWLADYQDKGNIPVLAKAVIKHKDIFAILNPSKDPRALEVVIDVTKLYALEISVPSLEEIEEAVKEAQSPPVTNLAESNASFS
jgi:hypothetical protein